MVRALVVACGLMAPFRQGSAVEPPKHAGRDLQNWFSPKVSVRSQVELVGDVPGGQKKQWLRFQEKYGGTWRAVWDRATHAPVRFWGPGIVVASSNRDPKAALSAAQQILHDHVELFASGAKFEDFEVVSNVLRGEIRTIGFVQKVQGLRVVAGQVSFRFKNDRLFLIASEAVGNVRAEIEPQLARLQLASSSPDVVGIASKWLAAYLQTPCRGVAEDGPWILPLVTDSSVAAIRLVSRAVVETADADGKFAVYVDRVSGEVLAAHSMYLFLQGKLLADVPVRQPDGERREFILRDTHVTLSQSGDAATDNDGNLSWQANDESVIVRPLGKFVEVENKSGKLAEVKLSLQDGQSFLWSAEGNEQIEAQLSAFVHARLVKEFVREHIAPELKWLDKALPVRVNIADSCNAFSDGNSVNFFLSDDECANTAQIADVVYHEFGHSVHAQSIIEGAGAFDVAFSEGLSDFLACSITEDPGMGRGFYYDSQPLRHIDPPDYENSWPRDVGEVHLTGLIFAGAMWDLRKILITQYGAEEGVKLANKLYYGAVQRASGIPMTYLEILAEDDDDGDLSNGTPNLCDINAAFSLHGLRQVHSVISAPSVVAPDAELAITAQVQDLYPSCPGDGVEGASLFVVDPESQEETELAMNPENMADDAARFVGVIAGQQIGSKVHFRIEISFLDGTVARFPNNPADPTYQAYVGEVTPLYCTDFETNPFEQGWDHSLTVGSGMSEWQWGQAKGTGSSSDPEIAYSGSNVVGIDLGRATFNRRYEDDTTTHLTSPLIDTAQFSNLRLQYRRWLGVEDGFFDQATIRANGKNVWQNFASVSDRGATHHIDSEWIFHDVPLGRPSAGTVQIEFELASDQGLEFGGWTLDDFCVVAANGEICGDGTKTSSEECDNGQANSDSAADACRTSCALPTCGDGVTDQDEVCDDGNQIPDDGCNDVCQTATSGGCGCSSGHSSGWFWLLLAASLAWKAVFSRRLAVREARPMQNTSF